VNHVFYKFCLVFAAALGKAIVREVAWLTVKAARREMEARDRYVQETRRRPVIYRTEHKAKTPDQAITYD